MKGLLCAVKKAIQLRELLLELIVLFISEPVSRLAL
jgi:hypothetical protein